jgi:hypothetical protein
MFLELNGRYLNCALAREISFNGTHTIIDFGGPSRDDSLRFEGDYRDAILTTTGGAKLEPAE